MGYRNAVDERHGNTEFIGTCVLSSVDDVVKDCWQIVRFERCHRPAVGRHTFDPVRRRLRSKCKAHDRTGFEGKPGRPKVQQESDIGVPAEAQDLLLQCRDRRDRRIVQTNALEVEVGRWFDTARRKW